MVKAKDDLTGRRFGKLTVICQAEDYVKPNGKRQSKWHCICDCEKHTEFDVIGYNLKNGNTTQCKECANTSKINKLKKSNSYVHDKKHYIGFASNTDTPFIFDEQFFDKVNCYYWYEDNHGYIVTHLNSNKHLKLHRLIMDCYDKNIDVDHINHDKTDNRKANLRLCTRQQNMFNKGVTKHNTSGVVGVYYSEKLQRWVAQITVNYKHIHLGVFRSKTQAIQARQNAEIKYFGKFRYDIKETI